VNDKKEMIREVLISLGVVLALGFLGYYSNHYHYLTIFYSQPLDEEKAQTSS
jgi:hypothetical protein